MSFRVQTCASIIWQLRKVHPQPTSLVSSSPPASIEIVTHCQLVSYEILPNRMFCRKAIHNILADPAL
jgi:hypothetical protein